MIYPIIDLQEDKVLGIITTETTNQMNLEKIIAKVKSDYPGEYCYEDLELALPSDCAITWFDYDDAVYW